MELTALTLTEALALLGGFAAAVTALYLLKLRRRNVEVPFVHLWQQVLAEQQTTRLFSSLKRLLSLLVALLIVTALGLAIGDPRIAGIRDDARTTVVLVDASASMRATDVDDGTRADAAKREVRRLVEGLGPAERMLIARMDASTVPLSPLTDDRRTLSQAVESIEAVDVPADLARGLRFARDVLRGQPGPRVVIVSDGALTEADGPASRLREDGVEFNWVPVGVGGRNVAITAFSVRRYPLDKSRSEVLVELWNPGASEETVELTLTADEQPIEVQRLRVRSDERLRRFFSNITGADRTLEARIRLADGATDDLPADDRAFARLPERRRSRVLAVTEGNLYLSAALLLDEYLEVVETTPELYPVEGHFDAVIFDDWLPSEPPDTAAIYLHPVASSAGGAPFEVTGQVARPFFDEIERAHPIVRFTALGDVNVSEALAVRLEDGDRVIAGEARAPLLVTGSRGSHPFVAFLFDLRQSDLPLRVAWPLLLLNTIDWFGEEERGYLSSYETGETWYVPAPAEQDTATLITPSGEERTVPVVDGRAVASGLRAGFYRLRAGGVEDVVAANLGPSDESRIEPAEELSLAGSVATAPTLEPEGTQSPIWALLVLAALGVLVLEWFTYHRRITV